VGTAKAGPPVCPSSSFSGLLGPSLSMLYILASLRKFLANQKNTIFIQDLEMRGNLGFI
jgi:hypothetical protein